MLRIFRTQPDNASEDYSASHVGKGRDYDSSFADDPRRALMWELERYVLKKYIERACPASVLDFACGTGRITGFLKEVLPSGSVTGIDISDSMLDVARAKFPLATFRKLDGREAAQALGTGHVDLVTAFRFFPNADPVLRTTAADQLASLLRPGGWLVVNNHRNFWSPPYVARRLKPGPGAPGTLNSDIEQLFKSRGFDVVARHSLGLWLTDARDPFLPQYVLKALESFNLHTLSSHHSMGSNTIWLLQKQDSKGLSRP